jgi:hypothetical protein
MIRFLRRTTRPVLRPISRTAVVLLLWSQRHTLALWFRSVRDEFMHQTSRRGTDVRRWKRLLSALWRISSDPRLANTPELRRIALDGDTVTLDASETWHGRYLLDSQLNLTKIPADDPLADDPVRPVHSSILAS